MKDAALLEALKGSCHTVAAQLGCFLGEWTLIADTRDRYEIKALVYREADGFIVDEVDVVITESGPEINGFHSFNQSN